MRFLRSAAGLIAALLLASLGLLLLRGSPLPRAGLLLFALGGAAALWQAARLFLAQRERERYDLSRLWDGAPAPPEEADETAVEDDGTLYCHACGHAVPRTWHVCPDCRRPLT